jgi:hypothetical protein
MTTDVNTRYALIRKLIEEEVDQAIEEDSQYMHFDNEREKEIFRDDMIANYLSFLKQDLQSDNA